MSRYFSPELPGPQGTFLLHCPEWGGGTSEGAGRVQGTSAESRIKLYLPLGDDKTQESISMLGFPLKLRELLGNRPGPGFSPGAAWGQAALYFPACKMEPHSGRDRHGGNEVLEGWGGPQRKLRAAGVPV